MKIKVLFVVFLLAMSFKHSTSKTLQSNVNSGRVNQGTYVISTHTIQNKQNDSLLNPISIAGKLYIADTLMLHEIKQNTAKTAENTKDGVYEDKSLCYAEKSLIIAIIAVAIALITLTITFFTLLYQKRTQENTDSLLFTKHNQYEVICNTIQSLVTSLCEAYAVSYRLQYKVEHGYIYSDIQFPLESIDLNEFHLELFYEKSHKQNVGKKNPWDFVLSPSDYSRMSELKQLLSLYNEKCQVLAWQIQNQIIDFDTIKKEYDYYIIGDLFIVLKKVLEVGQYIFKKEENELIDIIKDHMIYSTFGLYVVQFEKQRGRTVEDNEIDGLFKDLCQNIDKIMNENISDYKGVETVVDNTRMKWESVLKTREGDKQLEENLIIDGFMKWLKLYTTYILDDDTMRVPVIKYK